MKYIVFEDDTAIVFADSSSHKAMAGTKPVRSAGFCLIETHRNAFDDVRAKVSVWGESTTLNKKSNPQDVETLQRIWM